MFDIELSLAGGEGHSSSTTVILRRDYQEFRALHAGLSSIPASDKKKPLDLPLLPTYQEGTTDAEMAEKLVDYMLQLVRLPEVTSTGTFMSLLHDHDGMGGSESSGAVPVCLHAPQMPLKCTCDGRENAVDFLLQPCACKSQYVPRRAKHQEEVDVPAGSTVLWRFTVGDGLDIEFSACFRPAVDSGRGPIERDKNGPGGTEKTEAKMIAGPVKCPAVPMTPMSPSTLEIGTIQGSYTTQTSGTCTLTWDNSYSRLRGKQVQYIVQVASEDAMKAAVEAAQEMARASSRSRSLLTSRIQAGDGGRGLVLVKITPVPRPAMDADVFFNKDDPTFDHDLHQQHARKSSVDSQRWSIDEGMTGGEATQSVNGRRSSIGAIWSYLYASRGAGSGKEEGESGMADPSSQANLQKVMEMIEKLEDELARMTAKKEQAEAETVIALAKQRRWSIEKERFERKMLEALQRVEQLSEQIRSLQMERHELVASMTAKTQEVEDAQEQQKRAERERDVLLAEKHVWTVAHSGVQTELSRISASWEKERQAHEDTRAALNRAKDAAAKFKADIDGLKARLEQKVDERTLQTAQEELTAARAEIRDLTDAIEETAVENETLRGQLKLLAKHVKQLKQDNSGLQAELGQSRMRISAQDKKLAQLKAEKRLLIKELKSGRAAGGGGGMVSSPTNNSISSSGAPALHHAHDDMDDAASVMSQSSVSSAPGPFTSHISGGHASPPLSTSPVTPPHASPPLPPQRAESLDLPRPSAHGADGSRHLSVSLSSSSSDSGGALSSLVAAELEKDEKYRRIMSQIESCTERRKQLISLVEEDPSNENVKQLLRDLENVLGLLKKKLRTLVAAKEEEMKIGMNGV